MFFFFFKQIVTDEKWMCYNNVECNIKIEKWKKKKKVKETTTNHTKGQSSSNKVMLNTRLAFGMINGGRLEESSLMWVASGKAIDGF